MSTVLITPEAFWQKPGPYVDLLTEAGYEVRFPRESTFCRGLCSEEETVEELTGAVAVIAGGEWFTPSVQQQVPELKIIARNGVGYDRVDVPAATRLGKVVSITPYSNHESVAEHTLALLLAVTRDIARNDRAMRNGKWSDRLVRPIRGQTIGLIGLGRIGRSTAVRMKALGLNVLAVELYPDEEFVRENGIELVSLDELLARSDFVSLHCPLSDETHGMCDEAFFARMKPGSVLLNTSRGGLVNEPALQAALTSGQLSAAGLDVFCDEPPPADHPLRSFENVVLSPHLAGTDEKSMTGMGVECAENIIALLRGEWPEASIVNGEVKEAFQSSLSL